MENPISWGKMTSSDLGTSYRCLRYVQTRLTVGHGSEAQETEIDSNKTFVQMESSDFSKIVHH